MNGSNKVVLEWTGENRLRHTRFIALGDDEPAHEVRREWLCFGEAPFETILVAAFLVVHGPLHLLGTAKAFDVAKRGLTVIPA